MNALATIPNQLPAHLQKRALNSNAAAMAGIRAGGFAHISIKGGKFFLVNEGEKTLITDPLRPSLPLMELEMNVVGFNPNVNKIFYSGTYEEGSAEEPDCSSDDGLTPDPNIANPQSTACATCPQNQWGSKISPNGKQIKACADNKRLVLLRGDDLEGMAIGLTVTPSGLKDWANYIKLLNSKSIDVTTVVTKVQFDPSASHPKLLFAFGRFLTEEEQAIVDERANSDEVKLIAMPRKSAPSAPVATQGVPAKPVHSPQNVQPVAAPVAPAPMAPAAVPTLVKPVAPAPIDFSTLVQPDPVQPVAQFDPYEGLPPHVKLAVDGAGGLDSPAGGAVYMALAGKPVPSAPVAEPPKPVDPYEGLPAHVKPAVDAAGGLGSVAGDQVYKALAGKDAPGAAPAVTPAEKPKTTRKKTTPAVAPVVQLVQPVAQPAAPVPPPVAPVPAFVQPAATQPSMVSGPTVGGGGLGADLEALLAKAMGG